MDDFYGVDAQTLSLIIKMQLEDLQEMTRTNKPKGKGRAGGRDSGADLIAAIDAYKADLTATAQYLADEAMCKSIANAVDTDADLINAALSEEDQLIRDRDLAFRLSGKRQPAASRRQSVAQKAAMSTTTDADALERLRALNLSSESQGRFPKGANNFVGFSVPLNDLPRAESSSWAQSRRPANSVKPPVRRACTACTDQHPVENLARSPSCGHEYCRGCLISLFEASFTDETLFPPRCCGQPIPINACQSFFTTELFGQYKAKKIEFDTPNRTYCHRQACSTFVPPAFIHGDVARCPRLFCHAQTCAVCKGAAHTGTDCPEDPATQDVLRLAAAEGWQRCRSCNRFVELQTGCNHITCRCGAEFCYVCGERWKTCRCEQWDEENLLERAAAIVDRDAGARPMGVRQRENLVEQERANLMENHECQHTTWRSRRGRHRCEECSETLREFIYECRQCHVMACRRCRFNRL